MPTPDPNVEAAMGAAVDQARQDFIEMLDALVVTARKNTRPGAPLAMPSTALSVTRALEKMFRGDQDTQLWVAINILAEATLRLAHHDCSEVNTLPKETP